MALRAPGLGYNAALMVREIVTLAIVLSVVVFVLWLIRRAGDKTRNRVHSVQERVVGPAVVERTPRERKRQRRQDQRKAKPEPEPEEDDDDDDEAPAAPEDAEATAAYRAGLAKTRGGFVAKLGKLFGKKKIDADVLPELEEVLFTADIGPRAADRIFESVKKSLSKDELADAAKIWSRIRQTSTDLLTVDAPPMDWTAKRPFVLLILGVNGVGKTTTIGKLAAHLSAQGKKVLLAAGDTFRAAAVAQLDVWAKRANAPIVSGKDGSDPSAVIFEAVKRGVDDGFDVVICDTAGRLHTKIDLMDELKKVRRVIDKAMPGAPHETWMVLDATTGQNAITQAKTFKDAMEITGIVITKLDGSSKGGVILGICDELKVPVRYIGVGEKLEDLRVFDPAAFVAALYEEAG